MTMHQSVHPIDNWHAGHVDDVTSRNIFPQINIKFWASGKGADLRELPEKLFDTLTVENL